MKYLLLILLLTCSLQSNAMFQKPQNQPQQSPLSQKGKSVSCPELSPDELKTPDIIALWLVHRQTKPGSSSLQTETKNNP